MDTEKLLFLSEEQFTLLNNLAEEISPKWGVMNAQEMTEHLQDFFNVSLEKIPVVLTIPEEHLPKYREFLFSDKQFRENTKAPASLLGDTALPLRYDSLAVAKEQLHQTVKNFINYFEKDHLKKTLHPVFGPLDYNEWILLHYKHVTHHLRQFGLLN